MVQVRNADSLDRMAGGRKVKEEIDTYEKMYNHHLLKNSKKYLVDTSG